MYAFEMDLEHDDQTASLLVVQAQRGETLDMVLERVRTRGIGNDGVVVRTPVDAPMEERDLVGQVAAGPAAIAFLGSADVRFRRSWDRSVHILSSSEGRPFLTPNINSEHPLDRIAELGLEPGRAIESIKRNEMAHLVDRSKALLTAPPDAVFRAPSGHLVANFVRVGNIQRDRDAVDAIFFWMLPHLRDVDAILVDTWSISSIAFNAARAASTYFGRAEVRVEMLGDYVQGVGSSSDDAREAVERLRRGAMGGSGGEPRKLLVLISATQSGFLAKRLRSLIPEAAPTLHAEYLAIFRLGQTDFASLADLASDERFSLLAPDPDKGVLEIDSQVYFPLAFKDVPARLSMVDASKHRDFFDAYRDTGLIRIHCEDSRKDGTGGHQAIRLDLDAITGHRRFSGRLKELLEPMAVPRAILAPEHPQAQSLAEIVRRHFESRGASVPVVPTLRLRGLAEDDRQRDLRDMLASCEADDEILVVDDVCTTTASLAQIDKQLRTETFMGRVQYVIGIARVADDAEWTGFTRRLAQRGDLPKHTVSSVERVPLPDWNANRCPWCRELALYNSWLERGLELPGQLDQRRDALNDRSTGDLDRRAFLQPETMPVPQLGDRSFFVLAPCSQADVFAATAAALQELRSGQVAGQPRLAERHFPIATPLDDQDYLEQKWTDTVIRAAILRAATRDELVWTSPECETERTRRLERLLAHPDRDEHDLTLEILLAACMGKATVAAAGSRPAIAAVLDDGTIDFLLDRITESKDSR